MDVKNITEQPVKTDPDVTFRVTMRTSEALRIKAIYGNVKPESLPVNPQVRLLMHIARAFKGPDGLDGG